MYAFECILDSFIGEKQQRVRARVCVGNREMGVYTCRYIYIYTRTYIVFITSAVDIMG